jgi:hypothetical protein
VLARERLIGEGERKQKSDREKNGFHPVLLG